MRKSTLLWLALAAFCSAALFHTSQDVHDSREKLAGLSRAIAREEESLRVLQAEWSYLNQPRRLEKLAKQYLKLAPQKGAQFIRAEDIAARPAALPPPAAPDLAAAADAAVVEALRPEQPTGKKQAVSYARKFGDVMKSLGVER